MFYIIEKSSQLKNLRAEDCFVRFIPFSNKFHPTLTELSLIYVRPLNSKKGYMLCINHNESLSLSKDEVFEWLNTQTKDLWVLDKKEALHWYPHNDKLLDVNLIEPIDKSLFGNTCIDYYNRTYPSLPNVNCLIPISKYYEECDVLFDASLPIIKQHTLTDTAFQFSNYRTSKVFNQIESNGIKLNKDCFIDYYRGKLTHPEFNLHRSRIYTQYNLYTTTSRPSNTFNSINFAALNKDDGERSCYQSENTKFIEIDFQGYHPRLIGELVGFDFPKDRNTYEYLGEILGVTQQEAKELTFKQLYGGVWGEYQSKPFFENVIRYVDDMWDTFQYGKSFATQNKIFRTDQLENTTPQKLFNYIIQSTETSTNVELLELVLNYLEGKKTKLVLYTYDAFLFDYAEEDGNIISDIVNILEYPVTIKQGQSYHGLEKI